MEEFIANCAPHLKESSIKTYCFGLKALFKYLKFHLSLDQFRIEDHIESVIEYLATLPCKRRICIISALVNIKQQHPTLEQLLKSCNEEDRTWENKQELTASQKLAYLDWESIIRTREQLANRVAPLWTKLSLSNEQFYQLQDYVIACLYTYSPPRRCMDYIFMRPHEPETPYENGILTADSDEEVLQPHFIFQKYKTASTYGNQKIKIPFMLWGILREWIKINPYSWLLTHHGKQMTSVSLTRTLQRIFERPGFGVNMLRHAFVSDEFLKDVPFLDELKDVAYSLGHSMSETMLYKKHN